MTIATTEQARSEIFATLRTAWLADGTTSALPLLWPDIAQDIPDDGAWARVTLQHTTGGQVTIGQSAGLRRYRHFGLVTVQIFTDNADGQVLSDQIVDVVMSAFQGVTTTPGRVEFRNVRRAEIGPEKDTNWFQIQVLADIVYDEVK